MKKMTMRSQQVLNKLASNPKRLFLIDSLGALLSAFLLGVILVQFESTFGMPRQVLYFLSFIACIFALYSFFCYLRIPQNWRPFLKAIAFANLIYCCITIGLLFYFRQKITVWGMIYFILEIGIVISLVSIELKIATKPSS